MNQTLSNQQLIELLASPDWRIRHPAYEALSTQGQAIIDDILLGLKHSSPRVRWWCAQLLDHLADDRCVLPLIELLKDEVPRVRRQAMHSLACQRCKPSPLNIDFKDTLIDLALNDPSVKVRGEAVFGLSVYARDEQIITAVQRIIAEFEARDQLSKSQWCVLRNARYTLKRQLR